MSLAGSDRTRLPRSFFERDTVEVARALLGTILSHESEEGLTAGRIMEVEAYRDATDLASHAARLKRGGVEAMWGRAGIAYVYRAYGIHAMFNIVARAEGGTGAVLVRSLEPTAGIELMQQRRGVTDPRKLCSGPGNLCQAMGITLAHHGQDLVDGGVFWLEPGNTPGSVRAGGRIGITKSVEHPWRFFDPSSPAVSAHRRGIELER